MTEIDTYQNGNFKLEEWEDVNYCEHSFYKNDKGLTDKDIVDLLNEQEETTKKQNQEILSCHDTLVIIEALCDAVLNYNFKDVTDKADFCHMLNEMDNKDLTFLKECFEAIRDNDLKQMTSLTVECMGDVE